MRLMSLIRLLMPAGWPAQIGHPEQDCLSALAADWLASRALTEDAIANGIGSAGIGLAEVTVQRSGAPGQFSWSGARVVSSQQSR